MNTSTFLPDVNVLVAAHLTTHVHHKVALGWLRSMQSFATCATTEMGMVRILSNPVVNPGATTGSVLAALARVRAQRAHVFWDDASSLGAPLINLAPMRGPRQVTDFHLANLAAHHHGQLATLDGGIEAALAPEDTHWVHTLVAS
ncbi:MAG: VapC toxin family PIN domain ribonuclease [Cellulomonadaceae bacterium]|jgi:toxin-antitoxin system PIN domain toxin|nr:VapC toxin family PIN domain ribonuclease [Cellulomonadaceae bacterium]